jgi:small-conductance mechanosensitive channel
VRYFEDVMERAAWGSIAAAMAPAILSICIAGLAGPLHAAGPQSSEELEAGPASLAEAIEELDKRDFDLKRAVESARLDLASADRRFAAAQERLDGLLEPDPAVREEVAARRLQLSTAQRVVSLLEERIERVGLEKEAWERLDAVENRQLTPETLADWTTESARDLERFAREFAVKRGRAEELRQELEFTREQRERIPVGSAQARWVGLQVQALEELQGEYEKELRSLEAVQNLTLKLSKVLESESERLPLSAHLRTLLHQLRAAWSYQLTGSAQEPITPGKIVTALVMFVIGYFVAGAVSRVLGARVFPRMRLEEGAAHAFQSLIFYLLLLIAFLTALRTVQIPLTAFAVLGGALAIGVGFGSQNVVSNFISGLILLAERPIKLGDLIEVEGVYGSVERIGLRSTRVRTGDNIHIIVPNLSFLEKNVINWTHTDPRVRITVTVGVVYGSPTREVERLILQALEEHPRVLPDPRPLVLFRDFGNDALIFETRFWIEMRKVMDRLLIESDVRFRIDELFREAGIVIAFPQRDVHLDTTAPLELRITDERDTGDA